MPKSFNFLSPLPWKSTELDRNITSRSTTHAHPAFAAEGWAQPGIIRPGLMVFAVLKWIFVAGALESWVSNPFRILTRTMRIRDSIRCEFSRAWLQQSYSSGLGIRPASSANEEVQILSCEHVRKSNIQKELNSRKVRLRARTFHTRDFELLSSHTN